jgi:hypothetical protein
VNLIKQTLAVMVVSSLFWTILACCYIISQAR